MRSPFLVTLLLSACVEPTPNVCDDPSGTYTAALRWTAGDCAVAASGEAVSFSVAAGAVNMLGRGVGVATPVDGEPCGVRLVVTGSTPVGATTRYDFSIGRVSDGSLRGWGTFQIEGSDGSRCERLFVLDTVDWDP